MARKIKQAFLDELLTGRLNTILKYVREDDTLNLELRGDRITIYYRGGSILSIYQDTYSFEGLAKEYHQDNTFIILHWIILNIIYKRLNMLLMFILLLK
jgi:hypothetical protein